MPSGVSSCCFWEYCQRGWKRRCKNEVTLIFDLLNFLGENDVTISLSTLYYPFKTPKITKIAEIQYQLSNNSENKQYNFQYKSFSCFCYFCIVDTFEGRFKRGLLLLCYNSKCRHPLSACFLISGQLHYNTLYEGCQPFCKKNGLYVVFFIVFVTF